MLVATPRLRKLRELRLARRDRGQLGKMGPDPLVATIHRHSEIIGDIGCIEGALRSRWPRGIDLRVNTKDLRRHCCPVAPPRITVDEVVDLRARPRVVDTGHCRRSHVFHVNVFAATLS